MGKSESIIQRDETRRGSGDKSIKIQINFSGNPAISFIRIQDKQWYDNAIEKIDFVLELLPYHLEPEKLPVNVTDVLYHFDSKASKMETKYSISVNDSKFAFKNNSGKNYLRSFF